MPCLMSMCPLPAGLFCFSRQCRVRVRRTRSQLERRAYTAPTSNSTARCQSSITESKQAPSLMWTLPLYSLPPPAPFLLFAPSPKKSRRRVHIVLTGRQSSVCWAHTRAEPWCHPPFHGLGQSSLLPYTQSVLTVGIRLPCNIILPSFWSVLCIHTRV